MTGAVTEAGAGVVAAQLGAAQPRGIPRRVRLEAGAAGILG
ncbi:hypothetical protein [Agromyces badenianii]|nr:hypothetical protein [Agromyces badenianii]